MAKIKNGHLAIQICQNQGPISFQFSMKIIIPLCAISAFFGYKWAKGKKSRVHSLSYQHFF